jgi:hypothetical protein
MGCHVKRLKLVIQLFIYGIILALLSGFYNYELEFEYPHDLEFPQVLGFTAYFPLKQINYGAPMSWLAYVSGVILNEGGHEIGHFSRYDFLWQGFIVDASIYTLVCFSILFCGYLAEQRRTSRRLKRTGEAAEGLWVWD